MQRFGPYRVGETIGRGSMATVKVAVHDRTNVQVALKIIPRKNLEALAARDRQANQASGKAPSDAAAAKSGASTGNMLNANPVAAKIALEIRVLRMLKHPHVIRLYDVIFTRDDVVLVLEYAAGGELFDHLNDFGRLAEAQARTLFQQLLSGLEYCHTNRVAHRDLKPENIILDRGTSSLKLTDFDLAGRIVDGQLFDVSCGTPNYAAPEVVTGQLYSGPEADVWSAGVVLYAMLTGRLPFDDENVQALFRKIRQGEFTIPACVSAHARDLLSRLLVVDPLQRATIHQALAHPWVSSSIPRYIVDIHEACAQQIAAAARTGPDADGHRHDLFLAKTSTGVRFYHSGAGSAAVSASADGGTSPVPAAVIAAAAAAAAAASGAATPPARGVRPALAHATSAEELMYAEDNEFSGRHGHAGAVHAANAAHAAANALNDQNLATTTDRGASNSPAANLVLQAAVTAKASASVMDLSATLPPPLYQQQQQQSTMMMGASTSTAVLPTPAAAASGGRGQHELASLLLDAEVSKDVAALFQLSVAETEDAIHHAMMRREQDQREQLHRLVYGVPPRDPLVFTRPPPDADRATADRDRDVLVSYAILKHRKRAAQATRHRDPTSSASLGGGISASLRQQPGGGAHTAGSGGGAGGLLTATNNTNNNAFNASSLTSRLIGAHSLNERTRAVSLHEHSITADIVGQGSLGGLRACRVGVRAIVPPPGNYVASSFNEAGLALSGLQPRTNASLRNHLTGGSASPSAALLLARSPNPSNPAANQLAASYTSVGSAQSTRSASGAVLVKQPAPLFEPAGLRIPTVPQQVYNGISRRPGPVVLGRSRRRRNTGAANPNTPSDASGSVVQQAAGSQGDVPSPSAVVVDDDERDNALAMSLRGEVPKGLPSQAQRETHAQREEVARLLDKPPHFDSNADAAVEAWAQSFRLGIMAEGKSATLTFVDVFEVLKAQRYVWKIVRPFHIVAVDHVTRTKLNVQLTRCASNVPCKWVLDVRLAPTSPFTALVRLAETMEALALGLSGAAVIAQTPALLQQQ